MTDLIVIIDSAAALSFLVAGTIAHLNYTETKTISAYWLLVSMTAFFGFFSSVFNAIEWMGVLPPALDSVGHTWTGALVAAFVMTAMVTIEPPVKPIYSRKGSG